jgi:transcription elongation factor GreB
MPEGFAALKAEFHQLYKIERPEVVRTVSWAASNGDRSENSDSRKQPYFHTEKYKLI